MQTVKNYNELGFTDDFMFGKVMQDTELCHDVLECLLQRPVGELSDVVSQREFRYTSDGKPIRVDIYTRDTKNIYDTEMQNLGHKKPEDLALPRRSRFYQSSIDADHLDKTHSYKSLPDSNVLFICTFDPFGKGLPRYTFREICEEDKRVRLNDGTTKIFYNCTYKGGDLPEDLRELYEYVDAGKINNDLTTRIDMAVRRARSNEEWRSSYMKEMVLFMDAREEGRAEGREEGRVEGREEGRVEGREEERANTERERKRADTAENRASIAEARVKELEALLNK